MDIKKISSKVAKEIISADVSLLSEYIKIYDKLVKGLENDIKKIGGVDKTSIKKRLSGNTVNYSIVVDGYTKSDLEVRGVVVITIVTNKGRVEVSVWGKRADWGGKENQKNVVKNMEIPIDLILYNMSIIFG